jgi:hypothetical protein
MISQYLQIKEFLPSLCAAKGGQVQRSVDRVGKYARDINANALAQMYGALTHPADSASQRMGDPLFASRKEGKLQFFLQLNCFRPLPESFSMTPGVF